MLSKRSGVETSPLILFRRVVRSLNTPSYLPRLAGENNARDDRNMNFKRTYSSFELISLL